MSRSISDMSSSQTSSSTAVGIFILPIEIRYDIFRRVLAVPEPLYLFQDPGCPLEAFMPNRPRAWLALLYTSRQVSHEARAVLYGANHFTLEEVEITNYRSNILKSFITSIGPVNAGFLTRLRISFPATEKAHDQLGEIRLREDAVQNLQLLRNNCTGLKKLETLVYDKSSTYLLTESLDNTQSARDVLVRMNAELKGIVSLNTIIVRFCSDSPAPWVRGCLEDLGWIVLIGGL